MTEEDLEKKLKDYSNKIFWQVYKESREINTVDISNAYKDGYEQGQKDNCETHKDCQFLKYFEKENEQLKTTITKMRIAIAEKNSEVEELKAKLSSVYNCLYCGCANCNFENCTTKRS